MSFHKPDFRKLPLQDVVKSISALNELIVQLRPIEHMQRLTPWAGGWFIADRMIKHEIKFPSGHLPFMKGVTTAGLIRMIKDGHTDTLLSECKKMRIAFKQVYRARPGRKQFNLSARRAREEGKVAATPMRHVPRGGMF